MHARRALAVLALVPLAACGTPQRIIANPEHATRAPEPAVNPTVFPSRTPSAAPTTAAPTGGASGTAAPSTPAGGGNGVQATADNKFTPPTLTVKAGTEVTWTNVGGFHTVTGGTGGAGDPASPMKGTLAAAGNTYKVKFDKAGTYPYFCQPHEAVGMKGEIVVT